MFLMLIVLKYTHSSTVQVNKGSKTISILVLQNVKQYFFNPLHLHCRLFNFSMIIAMIRYLDFDSKLSFIQFIDEETKSSLSHFLVQTMQRAPLLFFKIYVEVKLECGLPTILHISTLESLNRPS